MRMAGPSRFQAVRGQFSGIQAHNIDFRVLMNGDGSVAPVGSRNQPKPAVGPADRYGLLLVTGLKPQPRREDPNLEQVDRLGRRRIGFAVRDARPGAHTLYLAGTNHRAGPEAVTVFERAFEDVRQDFHVPVRVRRKAASSRDPIFVQDAQMPERDVPRIVIAVEGKRVVAVKPVEFRSPSLRTGPQLNHGVLFLAFL